VNFPTRTHGDLPRTDIDNTALKVGLIAVIKTLRRSNFTTTQHIKGIKASGDDGLCIGRIATIALIRILKGLS
jgi:hypothetical protein